MYTEALSAARFGLGCAVGVLLFVAIFALTLINNRLIKAHVGYEAH